MKVNIGALTKDGLQTRVALDERTVAEYADAMREGATFPPVRVFREDGKLWLADGFHRVEAATRAGITRIDAEVTDGAFIDALRFALSCNTKHGKRVTNEDKQNAMRIAWENREALFGGCPSTNLFAETCGVHRNTAAAFIDAQIPTDEPPMIPPKRPKQVAQNVQPQMPVRPTRIVVGTDGKSYPVRPTKQVEQAHAVPTDRYGVEIPPAINDAFDTSLLNEVLSNISRARVSLRFNFDRGNIRFAAVRQDAMIELDNAYNYIAAGKPHCVCRMCQGNGCMACHERGWQTEDEYNRNPKEFLAE